MKNEKVFLDTNVLIYAAQGRHAEPEKFEIARSLILGTDYYTSAQVLAEFYVNVTKRGAQPLAPDVARKWLVSLSKKPCLPIDTALVQSGVDMSSRYNISYWDGAIIAAAQRLQIKTLLSEDLSHGQSYGTVTVFNPFEQTDFVVV